MPFIFKGGTCLILLLKHPMRLSTDINCILGDKLTVFAPHTTGIPLNVNKKSYLDPMKVIIRKYIQSTTEIYGYFAGATFANQIGLTTQMPATLEIITSKESTKGRTITVGSQTVRLKRPAITVTSENAGLLQFLDAVSQAEKYSEFSDLETGILLKNYAKQQNFSKELLSSIFHSIIYTISVVKFHRQ